MAAAHQCPACGFECDSLPNLSCPQCGRKFLRSSGSFLPWLAVLAQVAVVTGIMFTFHFPRPLIVFFGLAAFFSAVLGLRRRWSASPTSKPFPQPLSSQPIGVILIDLAIAILGLAFLCCLLFGLVALLNAHNAIERVQGQPYHATTFQVTRPYYQRSAGMHGPDIAIYASGMVEDKKEWMNLAPYLRRAPRDPLPQNQAEVNDLVPPGTVIPVYLFPNLKGQSRIQVIDVLPPGEASRRTETWVLQRAPVALAVLGGLIFLLVRIRRFCLSSAVQVMSGSRSN
jgi:hypothetical protein